VRFDRRNGSTVINFFVDGQPDAVSMGSPCTGFPPAAFGGAGSNVAVIGGGMRVGSSVANVRLFHRFVGNDEIAFHASSGAR
jgi:hypothetical protein